MTCASCHTPLCACDDFAWAHPSRCTDYSPGASAAAAIDAGRHLAGSGVDTPPAFPAAGAFHSGSYPHAEVR